MKKALPVLIAILIFCLGIGVCVYPTVSTYINKMNQSKAIENNMKQTEKMSDEEINAEKEAVVAYNKSLANSHIVLTDPFDPDAFPITDGSYNELLCSSPVMASISIPKISVNLPIYHGTDETTLNKGVGHLENTSLPLGGESTHTVLSAHTGLPTAKLFTDLDELICGDIFQISVLDETLSYQVDQIKVVEPDDSSDLMIVNGRDYVTLVTCTPYGKNTHRLLVRGIRIENENAEEIEEKVTAELSFSDKLLMNYGITIRELIVYISIIVLSLTFIVVLLASRKRKGYPKHEKKKK